jgi:hypothetical protein
VADFGWTGSEFDLIVRYLPLTGINGFAAVHSSVTKAWFIVLMDNTDEFISWFFLSGALSFSDVQAAGTLEPDAIP